MLKKLWLVLAASALLAAGQVSATEVATEVAEEVTEVAEEVTEVTQAEIEEAVVLAQALIDGDITASDLSAVEALQQNRNKRSKLIKAIVYVTVGGLVVAGGGYLAYNHFYPATATLAGEEAAHVHTDGCGHDHSAGEDQPGKVPVVRVTARALRAAKRA